ncbi:MAG: carboxylating nicotinate-nucleotide diphosphorylase [Oscillospiraceae bacterium]|nr:carboxylating nicotinate-nucleotide diphosphorylase [Oscillospiraceae bacterium]
MKLPQFYVDDIIKRAITEDINYLDATTDYLIDENAKTEAYFVSKDEGVLCGIEIAMRVFELLDDKVEYTLHKKDGDTVSKGDLIAEMSGNTAALLKGERTALNLLQHMSGIATATNRCVKLVEGTGAAVAETRKTLPGLRALQKYAVTVGGGKNHRYNLSDAAMLKDNHIDACGSIKNAVAAFRSKTGHMIKIEVEVRDFDELNEALEAGADVIMLDNMSCEQMTEAVKIIAGRAKTEASGNITLNNIAEVAKTGVDVISLGALTHSVKAFDISMKIK